MFKCIFHLFIIKKYMFRRQLYHFISVSLIIILFLFLEKILSLKHKILSIYFVVYIFVYIIIVIRKIFSTEITFYIY